MGFGIWLFSPKDVIFPHSHQAKEHTLRASCSVEYPALFPVGRQTPRVTGVNVISLAAAGGFFLIA